MSFPVKSIGVLLLLAMQALSIPTAHAAILHVSAIDITGGYSWTDDPSGGRMMNPDSTSADKSITPFTMFATDTNFVGGPLGSIIGFTWFGGPINAFTNVSGTTIPTAWVDTSTNMIYADMSAWYFSWGGGQAFSAGTGISDGWTSTLASGDWNPLTGGYTLSWYATFANCDGVGGDCHGQWNLNGAASVVPVPAALWLFTSGLAGLCGVAAKRHGGA